MISWNIFISKPTGCLVVVNMIIWIVETKKSLFGYLNQAAVAWIVSASWTCWRLHDCYVWCVNWVNTARASGKYFGGFGRQDVVFLSACPTNYYHVFYFSMLLVTNALHASLMSVHESVRCFVIMWLAPFYLTDDVICSPTPGNMNAEYGCLHDCLVCPPCREPMQLGRPWLRSARVVVPRTQARHGSSRTWDTVRPHASYFKCKQSMFFFIQHTSKSFKQSLNSRQI